MPRRIYEPDAITTDVAIEAIDLIEAGVTTLADMGIGPIRRFLATCSRHGRFALDIYGDETPTYVQCPDHKLMGLTHWLPCEEEKK